MFHPFLVDLPGRLDGLTGGRFGAEPAESGSDQEEAAGHIATGAVRVDRGTWLNRFLRLKPKGTRIVPPNSWLMDGYSPKDGRSKDLLYNERE